MRKLLAALVLVVSIAGAWLYFRSRVMTVWLYTDYAFRYNHANWPALVDARFNEVNRIYQRNGTGVRWKVVNSSETDPTTAISGMDNRRANMVFHMNGKAEIFLILTGVHEENRTGSVSPFTRVAIVVDFPDKSETANAALMARELSHVFGAPYDPAWMKTFMEEKAASDTFSGRSVDLIRRMRGYPFAKGIDGLSEGGWEKKALAAIAKDDAAPNQKPMAHAHTVIGTALINERKRDAALIHFRVAVDEDPGNVTARFDLAEAYTRNGDNEKALEQIREVVRLDPNRPLAHLALGALLVRSHQPEQALRELQTAARMEPGNADIVVALGMQQAGMYGHIDDSIVTLQGAVNLKPESKMAREALERVQTLKQEVADEIVKQRGLVQQSPENPEAHYRLGKAEALSGDLTGAIRDYQKSAELQPGSGAIHLELAELYYLKGDADTAWSEIRKARAMGNEPPPALIARLPANQ